MKNMKTYYSAILAGIFISLGCIVYTIIGGYLGAFLFAFGLVNVITFKTSLLYTGAVGYIQARLSDIIKIMLIIWGNLSGTALMALICALGHYQLKQPSLELNFSLFFKAVLCGMIMFLMVDGIKNSDNPIRFILLLGVPLFILTGMVHSVAAMFYLVYFNYGSILTEFFIFLVSLFGNFVGAKIIYWIQKLAKE